MGVEIGQSFLDSFLIDLIEKVQVIDKLGNVASHYCILRGSSCYGKQQIHIISETLPQKIKQSWKLLKTLILAQSYRPSLVHVNVIDGLLGKLVIYKRMRGYYN